MDSNLLGESKIYYSRGAKRTWEVKTQILEKTDVKSVTGHFEISKPALPPTPP